MKRLFLFSALFWFLLIPSTSAASAVFNAGFEQGWRGWMNAGWQLAARGDQSSHSALAHLDTGAGGEADVLLCSKPLRVNPGKIYRAGLSFYFARQHGEFTNTYFMIRWLGADGARLYDQVWDDSQSYIPARRWRRVTSYYPLEPEADVRFAQVCARAYAFPRSVLKLYVDNFTLEERQ